MKGKRGKGGRGWYEWRIERYIPSSGRTRRTEQGKEEQGGRKIGRRERR
jgi:hypothetical protein